MYCVLAGELKAALPVLHVLPAYNHVPDPRHYTCPLYRTPVRAGESRPCAVWAPRAVTVSQRRLDVNSGLM